MVSQSSPIKPEDKPSFGSVQTSGKMGFRVINLISSAIATPFSILHGIISLVTTAVAAAFQAIKASIQKSSAAPLSEHTIRPLNEELPNREGPISHARDVKIALLRLVPILGASLANHYAMTGTLKGFEDSLIIQPLLYEAEVRVLDHVFNADGRATLDKTRDAEIKENLKSNVSNIREGAQYRKALKPSLAFKEALTDTECANSAEKTVEAMKEILTAVTPGNGTTIRIPVQNSKEQKLRFHDATFIKCDGQNNIDAPVVIVYHGNGMHRNDDLNKKVIKAYMDKGYNVLLASYAGDNVISNINEVNTIKYSPTECSEKLMREDAKADIEFLRAIGVTQIGIHGHSLGGAQAMNAAQALDNLNDDTIKAAFVTLSKTFTKVEDVTTNLIAGIPIVQAASSAVKSLTRNEVERAKIKDPNAGIDGLNSQEKLKNLSSPAFAGTPVIIIGGGEDNFMSSKTTESAHDALSKTATTNAHIKARLNVEEKAGHNAPLSPLSITLIAKSIPNQNL